MDSRTADLTKPQQQPRLLTVPEAAKELRISNWLIYELIRSKQLKTFKIGTRRIIASEDINNFINKSKENE
jgi:excisionase family DNA binding protein